MKKIPIVFGLVFFSLTVFAQNKGDMYVLTTANASFGKMSSYAVNNNQTSQISNQPMNTDLGLGIGFGYFVANQFRIEFAISGYSVKSPREEVSKVWLNDITKGVIISPNISYYFKLADRFYYTPEIGVGFDFGKYTYEETTYQASSYPFRGYCLYANFLSFQFKVSPHFSMGVAVGDVQYYKRKFYSMDKPFFASDSFGSRLNSGSMSVDARFYF